jgi:VWFA-related protein
MAAQDPRPDGADAAQGVRSAPHPAPARIDAVVTDVKGRPVLDLKAADFELKAGGVVQSLESVELRTTRSGSASEPRGRTFGLFLDEFHVSAANTARTRDALLRFTDEHLRSGDRVVVMRPLDPQTAIEFAADRAAIRAVIEGFDGRRGDYAPRTAFEERFLGRAPGTVQAARVQIVTTALRALVTRLGEADAGRSAVALVTEGFIENRRTERDRRLPDLQGIVRAASRFNVAIHTLDPRDPSAPDGGDTANRVARVQTLAAETGGEAAAGGGMLAALGRMTRDLDAYYFLTFQPPQTGDGRFQKIEVSAKRRDLVVRARPVYWAPFPVPATRTRSGAAVPGFRTRSLRRSPQVDSWYGVARMASGGAELRVTWQPKRTALAGSVSSRGLAPSPPQPTVVLVRGATPSGRTLFEGRIAAVGADRASRDGLHEAAVFAVPVGRIELDLTILGPDGRTIDTESRDIDVPDFAASRPTILVPQVIRARTVREFNAFLMDPGAPPTPSREFRRGDRLLIRTAAYAGGDALPLSARLVSRWRQPMRTLAVTPSATTMPMTQFELPLSWLAPGEYDIEITATGPAGGLHERVSFRVTG